MKNLYKKLGLITAAIALVVGFAGVTSARIFNPEVGTTVSAPTRYIVAPTGGDYTSVSTAVTAACAASPAGGNVYVKAGTYTETVAITGCTNLHLILDQAATIQYNGANVATVFSAPSGSSRINIEGGKWLQTNATAQGTLFDMSNTTSTWIHNLRAEEFGLAVLYNDTASTTFYNSINDVQFFNNNNCVEYSGTQANNNNLYNVRCRVKTGSGGIGLKIVDARGITSFGSDWEPAAAGSITGISIDATSREIDIINNWIEGNFVGVTIASGAVRVNIIGSSITTNTTDLSDSGTSTCLFNTSLTGVTRHYCGSFGANVVSKTTTYTATVNDYTILCDATSAGFTVTLPTAASATKKVLNLKKIDASGNACTFDGSGAETIDDAATKATTTQYVNIQIQSDGSEWWSL